MGELKKRAYSRPVLSVHGSVRTITKGGNINVTDAPIGDNTGDPGEFPGS